MVVVVFVLASLMGRIALILFGFFFLQHGFFPHLVRIAHVVTMMPTMAKRGSPTNNTKVSHSSEPLSESSLGLFRAFTASFSRWAS